MMIRPGASLFVVFILFACSEERNPPAPDSRPPVDAAADAALDGPGTSAREGGTDLTRPDQAPRDRTLADSAALPYPAPLAYWSMDSADIVAGKLKDLAGSTEGGIVGAAADPVGKVGQALAFDGADDHVDFGLALSDVFGGKDKPFSVAMWVKPASFGTVRALLAKTADATCDPDENQRGFTLAIKESGAVVFTYQTPTPGNAHLVSTKVALTGPAAWHHLVAVYDGAINTAPADRVTLYLDGAVQAKDLSSLGSFPFDLQPSTAHLGLGMRLSSSGAACTQGGSQPLQGSLDEAAIWDKALSAAEAKALHLRGDSGKRLLP